MCRIDTPKRTKKTCFLFYSSAVIYANRQTLAMYRRTHPHRLAGETSFCGDTSLGTSTESAQIIGDVYIHPSASVHPSAVIGPNVSIGAGAVIGEGVRLRDCIVLQSAEVQAHACCLNSVIGWNTVVGQWSRVEGTAPFGPNPNTAFTKLEVVPVFNAKGQLNPSITVIGKHAFLHAAWFKFLCKVYKEFTRLFVM